MIIPDPETLLFAGDEVIVLAMVESERAIQTILVGDATPSGPTPAAS
jgi:Trk K+ transport system NAD-binding subunit